MSQPWPALGSSLPCTLCGSPLGCPHLLPWAGLGWGPKGCLARESRKQALSVEQRGHQHVEPPLCSTQPHCVPRPAWVPVRDLSPLLLAGGLGSASPANPRDTLPPPANLGELCRVKSGNRSRAVGNKGSSSSQEFNLLLKPLAGGRDRGTVTISRTLETWLSSGPSRVR